MAEMLIAPRAAPASTQAPGRSNDSRADEAAKADTEAGAPTPFAAVLKTMSKKASTDSSKEDPAVAGTQPAVDDTATTAAPTAPIDPSTLLSLLAVDAPLAAPAQCATSAPSASPALRGEADALTALPAGPGTAPVSPATTRSPAPTLAIADARDTQKNAPEQPIGPSAALARERSTAPEKLAAESAISAESGKTGTVSASHDQDEGDFHAVMERMANSPAAVAMQTPGTSAAAAPTPSLRVETPLGQAGWRDEMGQKLTWMASNNRQQAELVLNPPHLGRIEVTLTLNGDQATASFTSPHAAVRETLENSMVRLREVLADAGVTLGQTHVGADSRHDSNSMNPKDDGLAYDRKDGERHAAMIGAIGGGSAVRPAVGRGMVDVFA